MKVISNYSYDGGCGKTTATINIGRHLANLGLTVLLIDIDPKASLTNRVGLTEPQKNLVNNGLNVSSVLLGEKSIVDCAIQLGDQSLFILGTEIPAPGVDTTLQFTASKILAKSPNHNRLHRAIKRVDINFFDVVLIDCPPTADVLTINAIYASDWVISPVRLDEESVTDTQNVMRMVAEINELTDRAPALKGLILNQVSPSTRAYKATWPQVAALGVPVLTQVSLFTGINASKQISEGFLPVSIGIYDWVKGKDNA